MSNILDNELFLASSSTFVLNFPYGKPYTFSFKLREGIDLNEVRRCNIMVDKGDGEGFSEFYDDNRKNSSFLGYGVLNETLTITFQEGYIYEWRLYSDMYKTFGEVFEWARIDSTLFSTLEKVYENNLRIAKNNAKIAESSAEIYEAGRRDEWSELWDHIQLNGERTYYFEAFRGNSIVFDNSTFKPKYDFRCVDANCMFYGWSSTQPIDLINCLKRQGVVLDTSQATTTQSMFGYGYGFTTIPTIDLRSSPTSTGQFNYCNRVVTIEKVILSKDNVFNNTFNRCDLLENLIIEGVIGQNGLNLQRSPLTYASLMSIIKALEDKTGDTSETWTVTIGAKNKAKLKTEELNLATQKNWQIQ